MNWFSLYQYVRAQIFTDSTTNPKTYRAVRGGPQSLAPFSLSLAGDVLLAKGVLPAAVAALVTVAAGEVWYVTGIWFQETAAGAATVTFAHVPGAGAPAAGDYIYGPAAPLAASAGKLLEVKPILSGGHTLQGAAPMGAVNYYITGVKVV